MAEQYAEAARRLSARLVDKYGTADPDRILVEQGGDLLDVDAAEMLAAYHEYAERHVTLADPESAMIDGLIDPPGRPS